MAESFWDTLQRLRQGGGGREIKVPGEGQTGQPPLASFHESLRLLPNEALKALHQAGVNLENPSSTDQDIINDLRKYNKLQDWPWPKAKVAPTQGTPRDASTQPGTPMR
mgnify:CR=1 FL=1